MNLLPKSEILKSLTLMLGAVYAASDNANISDNLRGRLLSDAAILTDFIISFNAAIDSKTKLPSGTLGGLGVLGDVREAVQALEKHSSIDSIEAAKVGLHVLAIVKYIDAQQARRATLIKSSCDNTIEASGLDVDDKEVENRFVDGHLPIPYTPPPVAAPAVLMFEGEEIPLTNATIDTGASKESILDW